MHRYRISAIALLALTLMTPLAEARPDGFDHTLAATTTTGPEGGQATVEILHSSFAIFDELQGWSFGLCNDPLVVADEVFPGSATAALNGGAGPDFTQANLFDDGWNVGVVISFLGTDTLSPGFDIPLHSVNYTILGVEGQTTDVCFCDTLGEPPVSTVVVIEGSSFVPAFQLCGTITFTEPEILPGFQYQITDVEGACGSFTTAVQILDEAGGSLTQGFSMGIAHDSAILSIDGIAAAPPLAAINGGTGPSFFGDTLFADGWVVGVVYNFLGGVFLTFDTPTDVVTASYTIDAGAADGTVTTLDCSNALGSPPVANVVVVDGASLPASCLAGTVSIDCPDVSFFLRGDCNTDTLVDIADGIWILNELFLAGTSSTCADACDANFDGMIDSADATYIFQYRFQDGPPPPAPFPDCGTDGVSMTCDLSSCP